MGLLDAIFRRFRRKPDVYRQISHPKLVVPFDFPYTVLKDPSPADMLTDETLPAARLSAAAFSAASISASISCCALITHK